MSDAYVLLNGNTAEINLPAGTQVIVKAKSNSRFTQKLAVTSKDGGADYLFTGNGEHNAVIGQATITGVSQLQATFEYGDDGGAFRPSRLNSGGPYEIGSYNLMVIVAENGDDSDYNDAILEFSWYTPKQ
ncbi:fucose-binding lectin II [Kitasatospora sp. NPDC056138]|uniref:fucose-binding lectin II n=1 Tax=Kitasatospora sp. NPDC056138 TaxID=3345724 RepID=UPI0035E35D01